ncbi:MAG: ABC transporter permease [Dehalococcoidia bacterium]
MTIIDVFLSSVMALRSNVLRTFLTMLGIIIGVGAVIVLTGASEGAQQGVGERIRGLGSNLMFVKPGAPGEQQSALALPGSGPGLFYEDAVAIGDQELEYIDGIAASTAVGGSGSLIQARAIYRGLSKTTVLVGAEPSYQFVRDFYVRDGRFISEDDLTKKALVTVLGSDLARELFGDDDPVGESIRIFAGVGQFGVGFNFTVIGVMEPKGATATGNEDEFMFVPLPSFQARVAFIRNPRGLTNVNQINIKLTDRSKAEEAKETIGTILRATHAVDEDDFTVTTQSEILETATEVERSLQVLVLSIALISLVVGGLGIMNIMLVSVTERTREIGIRKAIGAKRTDILMQFLVEAFLVTLIGGILGVMGGYAAAEIAARFDIGGSDNKYTITPFWVLVGLAVSAVTGIVAGVYPAWRASRLDPIEALRHE